MAVVKHSTGIIEYAVYRMSFTAATILSCFIFTRFYVSAVCLYVGYKLLLRPLYESLFLSQLEPFGHGVFITGCDTGFGHKIAEVLDEIGFVVFASCLNENGAGARRLRSVGSKRMSVIQMDVTDQGSVSKAGKFVQQHLPRKGLWAIINNAGVNSLSEVELTSVQLFEKYLAVNLYGPIRVCKQFLPLLRKTKGRIVTITSVHGRMSIPRQSIYEVAKHGMETISDSLRLEMMKFGVGVSIIEPGAFSTSISTEIHKSRMRDDLELAWEASSSNVKKTYKLADLQSFIYPPLEFTWPPGQELMPVVNAVEHAIRSPAPRCRYLVCGKGRRIRFIDEFVVAAKLYGILPTWITLEYFAHWFKARKFRM